MVSLFVSCILLRGDLVHGLHTEKNKLVVLTTEWLPQLQTS